MINIAEILKDCPRGTKLYSPICGECRLIKIYDGLGFDVINDTNDVFNFSYDGRYNLNGECCIFPSKENRDWNTFQKPFKDGDIISNGRYIAIFHKFGKPDFCAYDKVIYYHCWYYEKFKESKFKKDFGIGRDTDYRLATEEEKQKLFAAIKANGYRWNFQANRLEKLIIPNFKKGDKVRVKNGSSKPRIIEDVCDTFYTLVPIGTIDFIAQDNWELVPNKFDITTLKPFDKVLVRDSDESRWAINLFGFYADTDTYPFKCCGHSNLGFVQCIPYKGNEHLLGTCDDCDEYFKNW